MLKRIFKFICFFLILGLISCNAKKDQTNIQIVQNMMDQVAIKSQDADLIQDKLSPLREPPENTVPRGYDPYPYRGNPLKASENLKNPLKGAFSSEVMSVGRKHFTHYCALCHGGKGDGKGRLAPLMIVKTPSLISEKAKNFTDGRIFHIIIDGQGLMGSYQSQISRPKDIWAVVNYIRSLQKNRNLNMK